MDDNTVIGLFTITYSILGVVIGLFGSLYSKIAELNKKIGELNGKLEMLIRYVNNNRR